MTTMVVVMQIYVLFCFVLFCWSSFSFFRAAVIEQSVINYRHDEFRLGLMFSARSFQLNSLPDNEEISEIPHECVISSSF